MAETVDRLKELLFDSEAKELSELSRRVEGIDAAARRLQDEVTSEKRVREDMLSRLDTVFEAAGTKERLETSVADVIDGALRRAEVERHAELADSLAPVVVRTVKTEIRNSKDELVEALYPMTGRMVKAYIASAMKDLINDINRRLESNPIMLRVKSLTTGKSVAELAMADAQRLHVEELYLIRRGSGELLWRWPEAPEDQGRDHVMSGILAAINEFSTEALGDSGSTLRQIDLGERQLYLRASPVYLLAAKCTGVASQAVEALLDEAFLGAIERLHGLPDSHSGDAGKRVSLLQELSGDLTRKIEDKHGEISGAVGASPVKILAWIVGLPLLGWLAWTFYADYRTERVRQLATEIISETQELSGYPVRLDVGRFGSPITVTGLAPTAEVRSAVAGRLRSALPNSEVVERLSVLPDALSEVEPRIARVRNDLEELEPEIARVRDNVAGLAPAIDRVRQEVAGVDPKIDNVRSTVATLEEQIAASETKKSLDRAERKLKQAAGLIEQLGRTLADADAQESVAAAARTVGNAEVGIASTRKAMAAGKAQPDGALLARLAGELRQAAASLAAVAGSREQPAPAASSPADSAEALAEEADWLASVAHSAVQLVAFKEGLPKPTVMAPIEPTARERLEAWTRANAVFFLSGTDYRDAQQASQTLAGLAGLLRESSELVRVIGYTDIQGAQGPNTSLSKSRADKVAADLIALGVPPDRLVALGRVDTIDISPATGDGSPNRRVEFEVGFEGEAQR